MDPAPDDALADGNASRLVEILLAFASHRVLTAAQITNVTGIPASAVYRHLKALTQAGLVMHTEHRGQYSAGVASLRLAANFRQEAILKGRITQQLQALSNETQELAAYLVISGSEALCLEAVEGPQMLRCSYSPGRSQPLHRGASATVLLAHTTVEERTEVMAGMDLSPSASASLQHEIQLIQARGFALSYGAVDAGVWGVSFPVFDQDERLMGAVTSMAPAQRAVRSEKQLISTTRDAALALGHRKERRP